MKIHLMKFSKGLLLLAFLFLTLAGCRDEDEEMEFTPGNQLFISGDSRVYAGAEGVRYFVDNNILDTDYVWSITGSPVLVEDADNDGFVYLDFPDTGTYELVVSNGTAEGSISITVGSKVVSFGATNASGFEQTGDENDTIRVPISITDPSFEENNPTTAVTSIFYTIEGTATEGEDYELLSDNPLILPAGSDADTTINIRLLDDMMIEEGDSIVVRISSVSTEGESNGATILTDSVELTTYVFNIVDDLKSLSFENTENDTLTSVGDAGSYVYNVTLSNSAGAVVTVPYTISGTGVSPSTGELLFTEGTTTQPLTVSLSAAAFAVDQVIVITLDEPVSDDEEVTFDLDDEDIPIGNDFTIVIDVED